MNEDPHDFFREGACLSEEDIRLYLQKKLSPFEENRIERHLLECALCSEALEGIRLFDDPEKMRSINEQLKSEVKALLPSDADEMFSEKPTILFPWRIAAAFILIALSLGALYFIIPEKDGEIYYSQEYAPFKTNTEPNAPVNESVQSIVSEQKNKLDNPDQVAETSLNKQSETETPVLSEVPSEAVEQINKADAPPPAATPAKDNATISNQADEQYSEGLKLANETEIAEDKKLKDFAKASRKKELVQPAQISASPEAPQQEMDASLSFSGSGTSTSDSANSFKNGIRAYNDARYKEAANQLKNLEEPPEALFYAGQALLADGDPGAAILKFQSYRKLPKIKLLEESWWYEAMAYLKLNDKQEAANALNKVSEMNGTYKERADNLLKKLK